MENKSSVTDLSVSTKISIPLNKRKNSRSLNELPKNKDSENALKTNTRNKILPSKKLQGNKRIDATGNEKGSIYLGQECLEWLISPWNIKTFMDKYWEMEPLYIRRENDFNKHVFSCKAFDELLRNSDKPMIFGKVNA